MDDAAVYLEKLTGFSRMLRLHEFAIGPNETADAGRILAQLGFYDRETVKTALRTVYAKSREEQLQFDRVFDGYFISEEAMRKQAKEQMEREREMEKARQEAQANSLNLDPQQMETYATLPEEERQRLLEFAEKYKGNDQRNPKLYSNFIHSVFAKTLLEQQLRLEDAAVGCEAGDPELGMMYRDISEFRDTEIPKAISIIQAVSRQVSSELDAKHHRAGRSSKLDFRRTIRKGLETGGSFYRLKYKRRRSRRKNMVILCDVSGSMIRFSEFALRFIQSLNQMSESSRVFLFSEEVHEANAFSLQNMDLFREYVKECGVYGKGTDLGGALRHLLAMQPGVMNPSTTLIILSDTKTVDQAGAVAALQAARRQVGQVLWMNPIPERHWRHLRSVQTFLPLCNMVSCSTLQSLAAACRKLTRAGV